jgi:hypothetical protein
MVKTITKQEQNTEKAIRAAQADASESEQDWDYGCPAVAQKLIDNGTGWHLEGSCGRQLVDYLAQGVCFLPLEPHRDYWGNKIPSRIEVQPGTKGSLELAASYWGVE